MCGPPAPHVSRPFRRPLCGTRPSLRERVRARVALLAPSFDLTRFLDDSTLGAVQRRVLWICGLVGTVEGFDAQAVGYIAPTLSASWHLHPGALGPVFSLSLFGLMLGALFIAPLADRLGRRPVLLGSLLVFGVTTLLTAWAHDLSGLMLLRFATGVGLGGAMPNAVALTAEYMPSRRRAFLVMMMFNGFNVGSMLGGILAAQFVGTLGWQAVFVVGGVLPLLLAPVIYYRLPESLAFLAVKQAPREQIMRLVRQMDPGVLIGPDTQFLHRGAQSTAGPAVQALFQHGRGTTTVLIWVVFFLSLLDIYMLVSWLPTALHTGGATLRTAIWGGVLLQLGSVVGCFPIGWALDRFGAPLAMTCAYLAGAVCIAGIGLAAHNIPLTLCITFAAGFGLIGGQAAANALAATSYPTEIRSLGVGWALGVGRIGSIIGPLLGAAMLAARMSVSTLFLLTAIPALLAAVALTALGVTRRA